MKLTPVTDLFCFGFFANITKFNNKHIMRSLLLFISILCSSTLFSMAPKLNWEQAVDKAISKYGLRTEPELKRFFTQANVAYPPNEVTLLAFKQERKLELWAREDNHAWRYIHSYPLTAFSGRLGPKLKERDGQIPEGIYHLVNFNPFSSMHLSMMIDYPNNFDRLQAIKDGRNKLGNNIFLHGKSLSVGCLAIGDRAIDQLFLLTRRVGLRHVRVIIAPNDLRVGKPATSNFAQPRWLPELYKQISTALTQFPLSQKKIFMAKK
jgi:hypothetical protein